MEGDIMALPGSVRRWARLSVPALMLVVGLAFRVAGVLPGWSTLLILAGVVGGILVSYVILLGDHERFLLVDRATEEARIDPGSLAHPLRGRPDSRYDGR